MARKPVSKPVSSSPSRKTTVPTPESGVKSMVSRNTPLPKPQTTKPAVTHEAIAKRAYEIHLSGKGGSQLENWLRAERELKGQ